MRGPAREIRVVEDGGGTSTRRRPICVSQMLTVIGFPSGIQLPDPFRPRSRCGFRAPVVREYQGLEDSLCLAFLRV